MKAIFCLKVLGLWAMYGRSMSRIRTAYCTRVHDGCKGQYYTILIDITSRKNSYQNGTKAWTVVLLSLTSRTYASALADGIQKSICFLGLVVS